MEAGDENRAARGLKRKAMRIRDFALEVFFGKHEFSTPHLLAQSDCESMSIEELLALEPDAAQARRDFLQTWLGYAENDGLPELRQAIAGLCGNLGAERVLVHTGAQEAVFSGMNVLLEKGDHLICMFPAYQSLYEVGRALGCEVSFWPFRQTARGWAIEPEDLQALIRPNTRAIVINTPHNPTGYALSDTELQEICALAAKRGIWLLADEVYKGLGPEGEAAPWSCEIYERAVSVGVMSKAYGLPGLRIGWAASPDAGLIAKMSRFKNYLSICCAAPSEALALLALRHGPAILARNRAIIRENLRISDAFFSRHADLFVYNRPRSGPIAFHKIRISEPIEEFCETLAAEAGVLLLPGSVYEVDGPYFRMGYGRRSFGENLARFEAWLAARLD